MAKTYYGEDRIFLKHLIKRLFDGGKVYSIENDGMSYIEYKVIGDNIHEVEIEAVKYTRGFCKYIPSLDLAGLERLYSKGTIFYKKIDESKYSIKHQH